MKGKKKFILLSLIAMSLLIASPKLFAQKAGTLKGQVFDLSGQGLEWAIVDVGIDSQKFEVKTDKEGKFELPLREGTYSVIVRCNGFKPSPKRQIKIFTQQTIDIRITLIVQGENLDDVVVTAIGTLKGQILDRNEKGVRDAKITVELNSDTYETRSDEEGKYTLSLPDGTHNVFVRAEGFINYQMSGIKILAEKTTEINLYLELRREYGDHPGITHEQKEGKLKGQILDLSKTGVHGAKVFVSSEAQNYVSKADNVGKFELSLPEGTYNVIVLCNGFKPSLKGKIKIIADQTTKISVTLKVGGENQDPEFDPVERTKKDPDKP